VIGRSACSEWHRDELGNIWQSEKLSKADRNKIVEKLSKLCKQKKSYR